MRKVFISFILCLIIGYLVFTYFYFSKKTEQKVCHTFEVHLEKNANNEYFVNANKIKNIIRQQGLNPEGKKIKFINTDSIENVIIKNKLIKQASVYITNQDNVIASIKEREPILRVINNVGQNYYIDDEGQKMPLSSYATCNLPIATGYINDSITIDNLYRLAIYLKENKFWNAEIEQIDIMANHDIQFIPRVGNQRIILGEIDNFQDKLKNLKSFYEKEMDRAGWNKYSVINLKFDKQIVCTKR